MCIYKFGYGLLLKVITIILICLFIVNDIAWAQLLSHSYYPSSKPNTLAVQSIFNPIIHSVGIQHRRQIEFEISSIIAMALRGLKRDNASQNKYKSYLNINSALDKRCGNTRREDFAERTIEVVDTPQISEDNPRRPIVIHVKTTTNPENQKRFKIVFKGDKLDDMFDAAKIEIVEENVSPSTSALKKSPDLNVARINRIPRNDLPAKIATKDVKIMFVNLVNPEEDRWQFAFACQVLAGHLRMRLGVKAEILDMDKDYKELYAGTVSSNEEEHVQESLRKAVDAEVKKITAMKPHILGLTMKWGSLQAADLLLTELYKEMGSSMPLVVMGNTLATFASDELLERYKSFSPVVVLGEGEMALEEMVKKTANDTVSLCDSRSYGGLPNIKTEIGQTVTRQDFDLASYALPDEEYMDEYFADGMFFPVESSRNCPWSHCTFCSIGKLYAKNGWRHLPAKETLKRIRQLIKASQRIHNGETVNIYFIDSEFFGPMDDNHFNSTMEYVEDVMNGIRQLKEEFDTKDKEALRVTLIVARVDTVYKGPSRNESETEGQTRLLQNKKRRSVYELLRRIGVPKIYLGIESGSPPQLKRYGKGVTVEENEEALKILNNIGFQTEIGFIFFDPLATMEDLRENIRFLRRTGFYKTSDWVLGSLRVQVGSPMVKMLRHKKLLKEPMDLATVSYDADYENADVADIERRFSQWEKQTRKIVNYMLRLKGGSKRGEGPIQRMRRDIRELDFRFVEALVTADIVKSRNEMIIHYLDEMKIKLNELASLVAKEDISDPSGLLLKVLLPKAYKLNDNLRSARSSDSFVIERKPFFGLKDVPVSKELLLLSHISSHLKDYPVDEAIDLSLIPDEDLEANMKTWAHIIALNNKYELDVNYIFYSNDEAYKTKAKQILFDKISELKGIDTKMVEARVTNAYRPGAIQVRIMKKEDLEKLEDIPNGLLPVALSEGTTREGTPLRDFMSASTIGIAQAAVKRMRIENNPRLLETVEREILPRIQHIYQRLFPDKDMKEIITKETILNMIDDNPIVKKNLALALALPPIIRATIQYLKDYHERMHILQEAA